MDGVDDETREVGVPAGRLGTAMATVLLALSCGHMVTLIQPTLPPLLARCPNIQMLKKNEWFPETSDTAVLKRRFKELAAEYHPDRVGDVGDDDTVVQFQELSAEYQRLLAKCQTAKQRDTLQRGWISVGGLTAVAATASAQPALAIGLATSIGSVALLSALVEIIAPTEGASPAPRLITGTAAEGEFGRTLSSRGPSVRELYVELDEAIEQGDYNGAQKIKDEIDEALSSAPSTASPLQAAVGESSAGSAEEALTGGAGKDAALQAALLAVQQVQQASAKVDAAREAEAAAAAAAHALELEALELEAQIRAKQQQRAQEQHTATTAAAATAEKLKHEDEHQVVEQHKRDLNVLPEALIAWGCDEELWSKVSNKKGLLDLLEKGDEERGRAPIARLRRLIAEGK